MNATESIPTTWDDARNGQFFRITAHLLDARLLEARPACSWRTTTSS